MKMSSSSSNDKKKKKKKAPPPEFMPTLPSNIRPVNVDDGSDDVTRRVHAPVIDPYHNASRSAMADAFTGPASVDSRPSKEEAFISRETLPIGKSPLKDPVVPIGWGLKSLRDIPMLPEFHRLERTAVFVKGASIPELSRRISNVLRERSIEASYDDEKAKARCMTADQVDFRIRMYRGRNQYRNGVIVEVQRRCGSSINFHSDTVAILNAAEGNVSAVPLPMAALPLVSDSEDDNLDSGSSVSSLEIVSKMLRYPAYDTHILALQTLASLTDPRKMGKRTALAVSRKMLERDNDVGAKVVSFVVDSKQDPEETSGLRVLAMTSLSNAIQAVNGNISDILRERLRPVLIKELKRASSNPRMAHLAAKCVDPLIYDDFDASEFYGPLEKARSVGQARHAALAEQAEHCMKLINSR